VSNNTGYVNRILALYWKSTSAGGVGFILTVALALPGVQNKIGPYIWVIPLVVALFCAGVVVEAEFFRSREINKFLVVTSQKLKFNARFLNEFGDLAVTGSTEVRNRGKAKVLDLPLLTFGYVATDGVLEKPALKVTLPLGKQLRELFYYSYKDNGYNMYGWQYRMPDGLPPGENVIYNYALPNIPRSEANAFSDAGESFIASPRNRIYESLEYYFIAPLNTLETKLLNFLGV
jgi:hypothetical protein